MYDFLHEKMVVCNHWKRLQFPLFGCINGLDPESVFPWVQGFPPTKWEFPSSSLLWQPGIPPAQSCSWEKEDHTSMIAGGGEHLGLLQGGGRWDNHSPWVGIFVPVETLYSTQILLFTFVWCKDSGRSHIEEWVTQQRDFLKKKSEELADVPAYRDYSHWFSLHSISSFHQSLQWELSSFPDI